MNIDTKFINDDMKHPKGRIFWRVFFAVILVFYLVVFFVGINVKKNIELAGLKIRSVDTAYIIRRDTLYKDKHDTVIKYVSVQGKSSGSKVNQKNDNGPNNAVGRDNSGNMGKNNFQGRVDSGANVHIGDVYFNVDKELTEEGKKMVLDSIAEFKRVHNITSNSIYIMKQPYSNGHRIFVQLIDLLNKHGYDITYFDVYSGDGSLTDTGIKFKIYKNIIHVIVGTIQ